MKFENLKKSLEDKIECGYLIAGDDIFLMQKSLELIKGAMNVDSANISIFNGDSKADADEIIAVLDAFSFIPDEKRLVILKDVKKIDKKEVDKLDLYLKNPNPQSVLVIYDTVGGAQYKNLSNITEIDCNTLPSSTIRKIVDGMLKKESKRISDKAFARLVDFTNSSMTQINFEVVKLIAYIDKREEVVEQDIEDIVKKSEEYEIYELANAIAARNKNKAIAIYKNLESGKMRVPIISSLYGQFSRMFFSVVGESDVGTIATQLDTKPFVITKVKDAAKNFKKTDLKNIINEIVEFEFAFKSGIIKEENANLLLINKLLNY
ncbi:MAG: DNA polymerase III subunit delta [Firmicutes bacterium]|nr:DNA polymerase III subunit delta [Bacillota bacterium]